MQAQLFYLHALSALHCGTGQSTGVVDLPIARARATQLPIVPGSSIRGVLREQVTSTISGTDAKTVRTLFGPEIINSNTEAFAGALAVGDAHLLVLPVRCLAGIVCYVTSPFILRRYAQDLTRANMPLPAPPSELNPTANSALIPFVSVNLVDNKLVLEDIDLNVTRDDTENGNVTKWASAIAQAVHPGDTEAQTDLATRFAILPDNVLGFLAETATEIRTRITIDHGTGTVKQGNLWYEENLPAETLLWGVYALSESMNKNDEDQRTANELAGDLPSTGTLLQLGGKAGVGRGLVRFLRSEAAV